MWVRFTADFSWRQPAFTIAYKAGMVENVTRDCGEAAVAAGKAIRLKKTRKDEEPWPDDKVLEASTGA